MRLQAQEAYMRFTPLYKMKELFKEYKYVEGKKLEEDARKLKLDEKRAQLLVEQLPSIEEDLPNIIKEAIWKLQILVSLAKHYSTNTLDNEMLFEKISTYAIRAKLADYSNWKHTDLEEPEFEVIDNKLPLSWVITMASTYDLKKYEQYAKVLTDKITLKEEAQRQVKVYSAEFLEKCARLGLDPEQYSERVVNEIIKVKEDA